MKTLKLLIIIFTVALFGCMAFQLKHSIERESQISSELEDIENKLSEHRYNPWKGIDRTYLAGEKVDTCLCTVIDSKVYKVNVYERTSFTYTPINN